MKRGKTSAEAAARRGADKRPGNEMLDEELLGVARNWSGEHRRVTALKLMRWAAQLMVSVERMEIAEADSRSSRLAARN